MAVTEKKKKIKVSKNKKKSWSKTCDVKDVEEFLEEKRYKERTGELESEKSNKDVFFLQTGTEEPAEAKEIKKTLKHKTLFSLSSVPPPVNVNVNRYPKKIKNVLQKAADKRYKKILASKQNQQSRKQKQDEGLKDLWAEEEPEDVDTDIKELITFRDEYMEKRTPNVPCHRYQKPSLLPAVEIPHPGSSYNPTYEDHQDLLRKAVDVEEKHLKEELHLKRVLTDMYPSKADAPTEKSILEEMSQGLFNEDDEDEEDEALDDNQYILRNPPVSADDRLPKSRKRKRKELKEEAKRRAVEKLNKQRLHEIYRLPSLKSEIKKDQDVSKKRQEKRLQRKVDRMYNPITISSHKYEPPDIEVNLTEEITGSLRTLKADGNILEDRYKSLQRRNLIEPRVKQKMKRKYKLKVQVKRSHRDVV